MTGPKIKTDTFFWLGIFMMLVSLADIVANLGDWTEFFWFCPVTAALAAVALFRRSALLLTVCLVTAIPAQLPWDFDFVMESFGHGLGRTAMLKACGPVIFWVSALTHMAVIPVAAWGVWKLGFHRRAFWPAVLYGGGLSVLTFIFTPPFKNVNCVFFGCDVDDPGSGYVRYFLIYVTFLLAVVLPVSFFFFRWVCRGRAHGEVKDVHNP